MPNGGPMASLKSDFGYSSILLQVTRQDREQEADEAKATPQEGNEPLPLTSGICRKGKHANIH